MSDEKQEDGVKVPKVVELVPEWTSVGPLMMEGTVELYVDTVKGGITNQRTVVVPIEFSREGSDPSRCKGYLGLKVPEGLIVAYAGVVPMLYGPEGNPLREDDGQLVSRGWNTDDCDNVFGNAGQVSWAEAYHQTTGVARPEPTHPPSEPQEDDVPPPPPLE